MTPSYGLYHGDCLEEMDGIESGSVDMILTDLPYGTTACPWDSVIPLELLWKQYKRVIKQNGAIVLFGDEPFTSILIISNIEWFKYRWVWKKTIAANFMNAKLKPLQRHEDIIVFSPGATSNGNKNNMAYIPQGLKRTNHLWKRPVKYPSGHNFTRPSHQLRRIIEYSEYPDSILDFPNGNNKNLHPTQKPVALLEYLIKTYTNPGELVLDSTMGSGSTGEACLKTGRRFIGIELYPLVNKPISEDNPDYFGIAQGRLEDVARELRGEWKPLSGNGHKLLSDLPLFAE